MSVAHSNSESDERDGSASAEASEDDEQPVEYLATGRAKRVTAGNRMSSLLEKEDAKDDDMELLFAEEEGEDDVEFDGEAEGGSDENLESSSDDEEPNPAKDADDLAGEKELQKEERIERKKRKAQDVFKKPGPVQKRVKINESNADILPTSTSPASTLQKPRKKSERVSWIHTEADTPLRTSSRKQTIKNREVVHKRLVDSEEQKKKIMRSMEAAQKKKDAERLQPMTQAEHMQEAAKVERQNAKSLNKWEEAEMKRSAEQKAKLEALHNRQLNGPVISVWSGLVRRVNDRTTQVGIRAIREAGHVETGLTARNDEKASLQVEPDITRAPQVQVGLQYQLPTRPPSQPKTSQASSVSVGFRGSGDSLDANHVLVTSPARGYRPEFTGTADGAFDNPSNKNEGFKPSEQNASLPTAQSSLPKIEYTSRELIALKSIDPNSVRIPELQDSVLLRTKKAPKPQKQKPVPEACAITSHPAKFRDPKTGLPYANSYAYKEIQRLLGGGSRWSNLLNCYVGSTSVVARGVPERFWKKP